MKSYDDIFDGDYTNLTKEEMAMYLEEVIFADSIGGKIKSFGKGDGFPTLGRTSNEILFQMQDGKKFKVVVEEVE